MVHRLIQPVLLLMSISLVVAAQVRPEQEAPLQARALKLEPFIKQSARRNGIDPRILRALCFLESRYRLDAISPKGARGPMQFMPATASRYGLQNPHDPQSAIEAGARYFRDLLKRFNGRVDLALAAYNAGEGTVEAFMTGSSIRLASGKIINPVRMITGGIPPYPETERYVRSAMALAGKPVRTPNTLLPALRTTHTRPILLNRDFSFDVLGSDDHFRSRSSEKTSTWFIEIQ